MKRLLGLVILLCLLVTGCSVYQEISNGMHYYCSGKGTFDIVDSEKSEILFKCTAGEKSFDKVFNGDSNDPNLLTIIRSLALNENTGIILNENNIVIQIYRTPKTISGHYGKIKEIWVSK